GGEDTRLPCGGPELVIGCEVENGRVALSAGDGPVESVRQKAKHFLGLFVVVLAGFALLGLGAGIADEAVHSVPLVGFGRVPTFLIEHAMDRATAGLSDPLVDGFLGLAIDVVIEPAGVVIPACGELSLNSLIDDVQGRLRCSCERGYKEKRSCERDEA